MAEQRLGMVPALHSLLLLEWKAAPWSICTVGRERSMVGTVPNQTFSHLHDQQTTHTLPLPHTHIPNHLHVIPVCHNTVLGKKRE